MSDLAHIVAAHREYWHHSDMACDCGWRGSHHAEHVAQMIRDARTIASLEQLHGLDEGTVIRDQREVLVLQEDSIGDHLDWHDIWGMTCTVHLPALLLWTPGDPS